MSTNKIPLTGYVDLTNNRKEYQFIYATQVSGTFFSVYAKFNLSTDNKTIDSIDFFLLNYKGIIRYTFLNQSISKIRLTPDGILRIGLVCVPYIGKNVVQSTSNLGIERDKVTSIYVERKSLFLSDALINNYSTENPLYSLSEIPFSYWEDIYSTNSIETNEDILFSDLFNLSKQQILDKINENVDELVTIRTAIGYNCRVSLVNAITSI